MFPIQSLHHLSFRVPDLADATHFYRDLLGFAEIERPDFGLPGAWLRGFGLEVHLLAPPGQQPGAAADGLDPTRNHVAFKVDDLDAVRGRLNEVGVAFLEGLAGIRQIFVLDPGANVIEFIDPS